MSKKKVSLAIESATALEAHQAIDSQVKAVKKRMPRRKFSKTDKARLINLFDACKDANARGEFLRKQVLYYSGILKWRRDQENCDGHVLAHTYFLNNLSVAIIMFGYSLRGTLLEIILLIMTFYHHKYTLG